MDNQSEDIKWKIVEKVLNIFHCNRVLQLFYLVLMLFIILCLTNKLNFIISTFIQEQIESWVEFSTACDFKYPLGVLEGIPHG